MLGLKETIRSHHSQSLITVLHLTCSSLVLAGSFSNLGTGMLPIQILDVTLLCHWNNWVCDWNIDLSIAFEWLRLAIDRDTWMFNHVTFLEWTEQGQWGHETRPKNSRRNEWEPTCGNQLFLPCGNQLVLHTNHWIWSQMVTIAKWWVPRMNSLGHSTPAPPWTVEMFARMPGQPEVNCHPIVSVQARPVLCASRHRQCHRHASISSTKRIFNSF